MSEVVERVAQVIYERQAGSALRSWSRVHGRERQAYLGTAKAAILALQPVTSAMIEAAKESGAGGEDDEIAADFAAMLSAAVEAGSARRDIRTRRSH